MLVSVGTTAVASVSTTVLPLIDGAVELRLTSVSVPLCGVFLTVKASLDRLAAAASASLKVMVSLSPTTAAEEKAGAVSPSASVAV